MTINRAKKPMNLCLYIRYCQRWARSPVHQI